MLAWLDTLLQGTLLGGLYALYATGLSLIFGIMRLVNLAHGDLIVFAAFMILVLSQAFGIDSVIAFAIAVPLMFAIGYGLQAILLNRTLGADALPPLACHLRPVDHRPERIAGDILRRQPAAQCRDARCKLALCRRPRLGWRDAAPRSSSQPSWSSSP
jgi:hypothetical protein